jgi:diacylglycerol kinase family enzyme
VDANKAGLKGLEIVTTSGLAELFELSYRGEDLTIRGEHTLREGFDIELASMAHRGDLAGLIFFIDPAALNQAVPNLNMLLEACHVKDIPVALNAASAELCLRGIAHSRVAYLIFNPVAGQGNPAQELALIRSILEPRILVNVVMTQRDVDPADQARDIVKTIKARNQSGEGPGTTMIIASGGDGTVSAVAGATIGSDVPLGIIPRGTANAFSVALGIPTDLAGACRNILNGNTRVVDGAQCNDTPMILLAGLGFEAGMVARATREKKDRLGCLAYVLAGVETFFQGEPFQATIEVEGEVHELTVAAITVANVAPPTSMLAQGAGEVIPDDGAYAVKVPDVYTI